MLLAADSFTVRDGKVRGLTLHLERFSRASGIAVAELRRLVSGVSGSPRLEYTADGFYLRQRPAREEVDTVALDGVISDERVNPLVKGPDIKWLASVKPADAEAWLVDPSGLVVEACFSAPILFEGGKALVPHHPRQLDSVTRRLVLSAFDQLGYPYQWVEPMSPDAYENGWLVNATHVRRFGDAPSDLQRDVVAWMDAHAEPVDRSV